MRTEVRNHLVDSRRVIETTDAHYLLCDKRTHFVQGRAEGVIKEVGPCKCKRRKP